MISSVLEDFIEHCADGLGGARIKHRMILLRNRLAEQPTSQRPKIFAGPKRGPTRRACLIQKVGSVAPEMVCADNFGRGSSIGLLGLWSLELIETHERSTPHLFCYEDAWFDAGDLVSAQGRRQPGKSADKVLNLLVGSRRDECFELSWRAVLRPSDNDLRQCSFGAPDRIPDIGRELQRFG